MVVKIMKYIINILSGVCRSHPDDIMQLTTADQPETIRRIAEAVGRMMPYAFASSRAFGFLPRFYRTLTGNPISDIICLRFILIGL